MRRFLAALLLLSACTAAPPPDEDAILAIGDSVMAWNGDRGIPEALAARLGRPVVDRARSGARLTAESGVARALGFDVSEQFDGGAWSWVVMTGGANDLRGACGTPAADARRDALIGPDGRGEIPALIDRIRAAGARVAVVGYYDGIAGAPTGFSACQPAFDVMNGRLDRLAASRPGVVFLDAGRVIDPEDPAHYARDRIHPSPLGAARIAAALADLIRDAEGGVP